MPTKTPEVARAWIARILGREPSDDESASARAARAIVATREPFNVEELSATLGIATTSMYLVLGDLRRAGYPLENVGGRVWVLTGEQGAEPVPVGTSGRKAGAVVHVGPGRLKRDAAFLRPPPEGMPLLGEVLRVSMLAEADGGEAVVLQGADGRRYFARFDSP